MLCTSFISCDRLSLALLQAMGMTDIDDKIIKRASSTLVFFEFRVCVCECGFSKKHLLVDESNDATFTRP